MVPPMVVLEIDEDDDEDDEDERTKKRRLARNILRRKLAKETSLCKAKFREVRFFAKWHCRDDGSHLSIPSSS